MEENKAKRIKYRYRGDNLYVIVNFDDDDFLESINLCQTSDQYSHAETVSGLEFVAGLVNLLLETGRMGKVMELAEMTSLGKKTLPGIVYEVLKQHKPSV